MAYRDPETGRALGRERFRRRVAERRAKGLCVRCGKRPPEPGRTVCAPCAEKRNQASRARDARLRAAGKPRRDPERAKAYERERTRRRAAERLAAGLCVKCGKIPAPPDGRMCGACAEKRRAAERARYAEARAAGKLYGGRDPEPKRRGARASGRKRRRQRREDGLCTRCGRRPAAEGGTTCGPCREARQAADRELYASRRAAGLCGRCGGPAADGGSRCAPCAALETERISPERKNAAARRRYAERKGARPLHRLRPSPRRGRRGAPRARSAPTSVPHTSGACPSIPRASPCSCGGPTNASLPSTTRWRWPASWPSRS